MTRAVVCSASVHARGVRAWGAVRVQQALGGHVVEPNVFRV